MGQAVDAAGGAILRGWDSPSREGLEGLGENLEVGIGSETPIILVVLDFPRKGGWEDMVNPQFVLAPAVFMYG